MGSTGVKFPSKIKDLSPIQRSVLLILRIVIGWHFLYEGIVKLTDPNWTSAGYLAESKWILAGIGGHAFDTVKACVDIGLKPDFWVKTLHKTDYWSSDPVNQHDNIWCTNPAETSEYMSQIKEPWIAFKILAAGAYKPEGGFKYAFENGADFICVGMYDFQIVDDANIALDVLAQNLDRKRPWLA